MPGLVEQNDVNGFLEIHMYNYNTMSFENNNFKTGETVHPQRRIRNKQVETFFYLLNLLYTICERNFSKPKLTLCIEQK